MQLPSLAGADSPRIPPARPTPEYRIEGVSDEEEFWLAIRLLIVQ